MGSEMLRALLGALGAGMADDGGAAAAEMYKDEPYYYECVYKDSGLKKKVGRGETALLCEPGTIEGVFELPDKDKH